MTDELVKRLRRWNRDGVPTAIPPNMLMDEAADRIDALEKALREADPHNAMLSPEEAK